MDREPHGTSLDESFLRRIRSLARTAPLHELEAGKVMRAGDWSAYDLRALCLAAIDTTIEHMGLEYGAPAETIVRTLADVAARSAPERPAEEHQRVATAVLEGLLNERDRRQAFTVSYADPTDEGNRHVLAFHLLREIEATNGTIVVRATTEAINLFVGALDLDVEDAQAAAEAVLRSQLARGRLDQAVSTAREARIRSIQFAEKIRSILDATRRDIRQVDWHNEVPQMLAEALAHLSERLEVEHELIRTTDDTLDRADPTKAHRVAELVELLRDCRNRHWRLHNELIRARGVFLDEQQRQVFAPAVVLPLPDPEGELLMPLLAADRATAMEPLAAFFRAAVGAEPPAVMRLTTLLSSLLQPRREHGPDGLEVYDLELEQAPVNLMRFSEEDRLTVQGLISRAASTPLRLSRLLQSAREHGPGVPDLIALVALRQFAPEAGDKAGDTPDDHDLAAAGLISIDDGTPLADPGFGGADLLVSVLPDQPEQRRVDGDPGATGNPWDLVELGAARA